MSENTQAAVVIVVAVTAFLVLGTLAMRIADALVF